MKAQWGNAPDTAARDALDADYRASKVACQSLHGWLLYECEEPVDLQPEAFYLLGSRRDRASGEMGHPGAVVPLGRRSAASAEV